MTLFHTVAGRKKRKRGKFNPKIMEEVEEEEKEDERKED